MTPEGTIFIAVGSAGGSAGVLLSVFPDSVFGGERFHLRARGSTGRSFDYNYGDKDRHKVRLDHVPASVALAINSLWYTSSFVGVITGSSVLIDQAKILNDEAPLRQTAGIYVDEYSGTLELGAY